MPAVGARKGYELVIDGAFGAGGSGTRGGRVMFTDWDERFDLLVGADIQDTDTEPWLDSGVHDLLYGSASQDPETPSFRRPQIGDEGRHVIDWIRDRRFP